MVRVRDSLFFTYISIDARLVGKKGYGQFFPIYPYCMNLFRDKYSLCHLQESLEISYWSNSGIWTAFPVEP